MKTVSATCSVEPIPLTDIDALNQQVQELAMEKQRLLQELATARHPSAERKCFICDGAHIHCLGIMNCPEM